MTAFHPISPRSALQILESADIGVDGARLLLDLAEAGLIRGYARLVETIVPGTQPTEVRDSRIGRELWKRIVAEQKVEEVFAAGSVRIAGEGGSTSLIGIRFDARSVQVAAQQHGTGLPKPETQRISPGGSASNDRSISKPAACERDLPVQVNIPKVKVSSRRPDRLGLPEGAVSVSISDASAAMGLSRGTIYKLLDKGDLTSVKIGNRRLISADSIRTLIAAPDAPA